MKTLFFVLCALLAGAMLSANDPPPSPTPSAGPPRSKPGAEESRPATEPNSIQELLERGEEHFFARRFHVALRIFARVKDMDPENYLATTYSADIYTILKRYSEAIENYKVAVELSPSPYQEYFRLGQVYYLERKADLAQEAFENALKARSELAECHYYLGLIHLRFFNNKEKAREHFAVFLAARPQAQEASAVNRILQDL